MNASLQVQTLLESVSPFTQFQMEPKFLPTILKSVTQAIFQYKMVLHIACQATKAKPIRLQIIRLVKIVGICPIQTPTTLKTKLPRMIKHSVGSILTHQLIAIREEVTLFTKSSCNQPDLFIVKTSIAIQPAPLLFAKTSLTNKGK